MPLENSLSKRYRLLLILLIGSIPAYRLIPFHAFWGLDLHNLYVFHNCESRNRPYLIAGSLCGDSLGREMFYPPFLYWCFFWLRHVSFRTAILLWTISIPIALFLSFRNWAPLSRKKLALWLLLLVQFPVVFAMERGNSDILVVLLWTLSFVFFRSHRFFLSGF